MGWRRKPAGGPVDNKLDRMLAEATKMQIEADEGVQRRKEIWSSAERYIGDDAIADTVRRAFRGKMP